MAKYYEPVEIYPNDGVTLCKRYKHGEMTTTLLDDYGDREVRYWCLRDNWKPKKNGGSKLAPLYNKVVIIECKGDYDEEISLNSVLGFRNHCGNSGNLSC